jgi:cytochrome b subunit of formate dehydrogenase
VRVKMRIIVLRRIVSLSLFVLWVITGITGILLLIGPLLAKIGIYVLTVIPDIHTYVGFGAFGISVIHIALNWDALRSYMRIIRPKPKAQGSK